MIGGRGKVFRSIWMNGLSCWSLLQKSVLNKFDFEFFEIYPLQLDCSTVINLFKSLSPSRCIFVSSAFSLYKLGYGRRAKIQATLSLKGPDSSQYYNSANSEPTSTTYKLGVFFSFASSAGPRWNTPPACLVDPTTGSASK